MLGDVHCIIAAFVLKIGEDTAGNGISASLLASAVAVASGGLVSVITIAWQSRQQLRGKLEEERLKDQAELGRLVSGLNAATELLKGRLEQLRDYSQSDLDRCSRDFEYLKHSDEAQDRAFIERCLGDKFDAVSFLHVTANYLHYSWKILVHPRLTSGKVRDELIPALSNVQYELDTDGPLYFNLQTFLGQFVSEPAGTPPSLDHFIKLIADRSRSQWLQPLFDFFLQIKSKIPVRLDKVINSLSALSEESEKPVSLPR